MFDSLIRFVIARRALVVAATIGMALLGFWSYSRLPIDAVPDITNVQVQVNTEAPGYSPLEAEQRITQPLEAALAGLPGMQETRSLSRYGLSQITVVFEDGTDIYFARQQVNERIQTARERLPGSITPQLGPIATGLGEIYLWTVDSLPGAKKPDGSPYTPEDLRTLQDWVIKPQLRTVPGVTEVNAIGGYVREYQIAPDPLKLVQFGLDWQDIVTAVAANNDNASAGYIEKNGEQYLIRAPGQVQSLDDIRRIVVTHRSGVPVPLDAVADVYFGKELRTGAATSNGHEVVLGTVFMLMGENSRAVAARVGERMQEVQKSLPEGVVATPVYDRTGLVDKAIATVKKNLAEGALLVIAVLFVFLGNARAALLTALVIPLAMLFTFTGMVANQVSANLMSLGAIDFGIIVDGAVVIVENCIRRLGEAQHRQGRALSLGERLEVVFQATREVRRAILFGQLIIMVVFLPLFTFSGVEGKMFTPMAYTVVIALLGATLLSITFVPAGVALWLSQPVAEQENAVLRRARELYEPWLQRALAKPKAVLAAAAGLLLFCTLLATRLGTEFMPALDEHDIALHALRIPGTSLTQAVAMQSELEAALKKHPEVERVFAKIGTAEVATDPMPPSVADNLVMLKPRSEWPDPGRDKRDFVAALEKTAAGVLGNNYEFTQPIEMRFNELISGVRSDVAVKVFGDDMALLLEQAEAIEAALKTVPGAADVKVEQVTGLPMLTLQIRRDALARHGLNVADVQAVIHIAMGGETAGHVFEGDRRFDIVVRLPEVLRGDLEALRRLPIRLPEAAGGPSRFIPLSSVANVELAPGPNQVSRENGKRRVVVTANVRDRDLGSFVADAQSAIAEQVTIAPGYWLDWGGQFEQLAAATKRLLIVVPAALLLILTLLYATFGNWRDGLLVFSGVPLALTGGILALALRGMPLSISAVVGFIALSGVAVLNGLVLVSFIRQLHEQGMTLAEAVSHGAVARLRPVLMTALVASLGFLPMALATGTGAEVQKPLATVVIGGLLTSTLLTMFVLPVLYQWFGAAPERQGAD
jgi:cobalt-zinc-cadmium resistance protein CzcA